MCPWEKVKFLTDWICTSLCVCVCYQRQGHLAFSRTMTSHSLISATPSSRVWEHTCLCCLHLHMCVFLCNCSLFGISLSVCHFSLIRVWIFWVYQQWVLKSEFTKVDWMYCPRASSFVLCECSSAPVCVSVTLFATLYLLREPTGWNSFWLKRAETDGGRWEDKDRNEKGRDWKRRI